MCKNNKCMNTKQLMIYILSVVATVACSLFAGWSVRDNCGEWLSLTLLIGAGVALLMQLYFLIKSSAGGPFVDVACRCCAYCIVGYCGRCIVFLICICLWLPAKTNADRTNRLGLSTTNNTHWLNQQRGCTAPIAFAIGRNNRVAYHSPLFLPFEWFCFESQSNPNSVIRPQCFQESCFGVVS